MTSVPNTSRTDVERQSVAWLVGFAATMPALGVLVIFRPTPPDLIAQMARAGASGWAATSAWWTSWYGGITTPSYSVVAPLLMRVAGPWTVGLIALVVTIFATVRLVERSHRPHLAIALSSVAASTDLLSGRVTFAAGIALAVLAFLLAQQHRARPMQVILAIAATLTSPLAGMFLVFVAVATWPRLAAWRRHALLILPVLGAGLMVAILYPLRGDMPMDLSDLLAGVALPIAAFALRTHPAIKRLALMLGVLTVVVFLIPTPIGGNALRLPMLFSAAAIAATSTARRTLLIPALAVTVGWFSSITYTDVTTGVRPSATAPYYNDLLRHLPPSGTAVNRVEVIQPQSQGPALYVAQAVPLARGWERQVDFARNPFFYDDTLNASVYHDWLNRLAVRWIALPNTTVDFGSTSEAALVSAGLPYLRTAWSDSDWKLYEVVDAAPMVTAPAVVTSVTPHQIEISIPAAGSGTLKVAWDAGLELTPANGIGAPGKLESADGQTRYAVTVPGNYVLHG